MDIRSCVINIIQNNLLFRNFAIKIFNKIQPGDNILNIDNIHFKSNFINIHGKANCLRCVGESFLQRCQI